MLDSSLKLPAAAASRFFELTALMREGRFEEAAAACGELISEKPDDAVPYLYLAQLARMAGDPERAAKFLGEAIVRDSSNGASFAELSDVLWDLGRKEFSIRAMEAALTLGADDARKRRSLADRLYHCGAAADAGTMYAKVLELEPDCQRSKAMLTLLRSSVADVSRATGPSQACVTGVGHIVESPLWKHVHLCLFSPPGYSHIGAFAEVMDSMESSFRRLGCHTTSAQNEMHRDSVNIVFGGHLIGPGEDLSRLPRSTVLLNLEQASGFGLDRYPIYKSLLRRFPVWDYSARNATALREMGAAVTVFRLGYEPVLEKIPPSSTYDCDVLFYGSLNERRDAVLRGLRSAGLSVRHLFNVYGKERDQAIASARIVLNLHYYEDAIHEIVRTSYLLANRKAVVSECNSATEIDDDIRQALIAVPHQEIVPTCIRLAADKTACQGLAQKGYELFRQCNQAESVLEAIENTRLLALG